MFSLSEKWSIMEERRARPTPTNMEREEGNRRRYGKNLFWWEREHWPSNRQWNVCTRTWPAVNSALTEGKERKRGDRTRKGQERKLKKGKEECSQDESSDGWNSFNRDRKQGVCVCVCVCVCVSRPHGNCRLDNPRLWYDITHTHTHTNIFSQRDITGHLAFPSTRPSPCPR